MMGAQERRILTATRTATQPGFCETQLNQSEGNEEEKRNLVHGGETNKPVGETVKIRENEWIW